MSAAVQFLYTVNGVFDGTTPNPPYASSASSVVATVNNLGLIDPDSGTFNSNTASQHTVITYVGITVAGGPPTMEIIDPANGSAVISTFVFNNVAGNEYISTKPTLVYPGALIRISGGAVGANTKLRIDQLNVPDAASLAPITCTGGGGGGGSINTVTGAEEIVTTTVGDAVTVYHRIRYVAQNADFTAAAGGAYLVNTSAGAVTVTLPAAPADGAIVTIKDSTGSFATNNVTVAGAGSNVEQPTGGTAGSATLATNWWAYRYVYQQAGLSGTWWLT